MRYPLVLLSVSVGAAAALIGACTGDDPILTDVDPCADNACAEGGTPDGASDGSSRADGGPLGDGGCTAPCNGDLVWLKSFGSTGGDQVLEGSVDSAGNIYVLATSGGAISFGAAASVSAASTFVVKLDTDGNALWAKALGGVIQQPHIAVSKDGNVFVAGTYFRNQFQTLPITWDGADTGLPTNIGTSGYDIFALEIDSAGARRLAVQIGADSYDEMRAIGVDHDGSLVIFGQAAAALTFRARAIPKGPFVIELTAANFDVRWVHPIGIQNAGNVRAASIVPMESGDVAVSGTYGGEVAFDGTTFSGSSAAPVATDTFTARFKSADGALSNTNDSFLSLYGNVNAAGLPASVTTLASSAFGGTQALALVGQFHGWVGLGSTTPFLQVGDAGLTTRDPGTYLAVFSSATLLPLGYRGVFDGESSDVKHVAVDSLGNVSMAGSFEDAVDYGGGPLTSAGAGDGFVALYDPTLKKHLWSKRFGGPIEDRAVGMGVDPNGNVIVVGEFQATADFPGDKQLVSAGGVKNLFMMKLAR